MQANSHWVPKIQLTHHAHPYALYTTVNYVRLAKFDEDQYEKKGEGRLKALGMVYEVKRTLGVGAG